MSISNGIDRDYMQAGSNPSTLVLVLGCVSSHISECEKLAVSAFGKTVTGFYHFNDVLFSQIIHENIGVKSYYRIMAYTLPISQNWPRTTEDKIEENRHYLCALLSPYVLCQSGNRVGSLYHFMNYRTDDNDIIIFNVAIWDEPRPSMGSEIGTTQGRNRPTEELHYLLLCSCVE